MANAEQIVDVIYEAACLPELWPKVFEQISAATGSAYGVLVSLDRGDVRMAGGEVASKLIADFNHWGPPESNPRILVGGEDKYHAFLTDFDVFTEEQIESSPFYRDFMRPRGFGWFAGTFFGMPSGETVIVSFERRYDSGPFSPETARFLNGFRPHLARACLISARLALSNAQAATDALARIGVPAAVLSPRGKAIDVNPLLAAMIPGVLRDGRDRVSFAQPTADRMLAAALERVAGSASAGAVNSFPVSGPAGAPMVAHVAPFRRSARQLFDNAGALLLVTSIDGSKAPSEVLLRGLFDLTAAEAAIARAIAQGRDLGAIAGSRGVSVETVRSQLKTVLGKTGTGRQVELAALLAGLLTPP